MKQTIQGTSVFLDNTGILIQGVSGTGKSSLALNLIEANKGAVLISDDITELSEDKGQLLMFAPATIKGMLEVRHLGVLTGYKTIQNVPLKCIIQLVSTPPERAIAEVRYTIINNVKIPIFQLHQFDFSLTSKVQTLIKVLNRELDFLDERVKVLK